MADDNQSSYGLNAAIGFLGLLLCALLFGVFTRIIYPRIQSNRAEAQSGLISDVIQVEVLNGCGIAGLADSFTSTLRKNGFDVVETGNFKNFDIKQTTVIARTANAGNAKRIARALGIDESQVLIEASDDFYLDATIIIGADYNSLELN